MILKTNLHLHIADDPIDRISYTVNQMIDYARSLNFNVLALTCHTKFAFKKEHGNCAMRKGILLIPGIEARIENKDVIILNCDKSIEEVTTFKELRTYKNKRPQIFILAPHPFVFSLKRRSLNSKLFENIDLFDAIELTVFSNRFFNFNIRADRAAKKWNKPLVATSDTHYLKDLERGYTLINASEKTTEAVLDAIKKGKFENKINSMNLSAMLEFKIKSGLSYCASSQCKILKSGSTNGVKGGES